MFVDAILPGRASEVRPMNEREVNLTMVIAVEIDEASAKISSGPTEDFPEDLDLPIWSGTVPALLQFSAPVASMNGAMLFGNIPVPESVSQLLSRQ
jgi:hypothetical protein